MRSVLFAFIATISVAAASASTPEVTVAATEVTATTVEATMSEVDVDKRGLLDPIICLFGTCINTQTDSRNCGSRGNVCRTTWPNGSGAQCVQGNCMPQFCATGFALNTNTGTCVSISNDVNNCGSIGSKCALANAVTQTCVSGTCVAQSCALGYAVSAGTCQKTYNLLTDTSNCGAIGKACPTSYANGSGSTCVNGQCQPVNCNTGYAFSAGTGTCQNILTSTTNCGSLGNVCSFANGAGSCVNGVCTLSTCNPGFYNVNGQCTYLSLSTDSLNCGTVGNVCSFSNGYGSCQAGKCTFISCATGYKLVNNACQRIDYSSDPLNCGVSGYACPASYMNGGSGMCVNGKCMTTCNAGYQFDSTLNFCRATTNDVLNCGSIGRACTATNGIPSCNNGVCGVASCNSGYKLISGRCQAIDYSCDVNNCGSAGNVCPSSYPNGGTGVCAAGKCYTTCNPGYYFDVQNNYCRDVSGDINNCGSLGYKCNIPGATAQSCVSGVCRATSCGLGYNLASGTCSSVNTLSDINNCGAVGKQCSFSPSGASGICQNGHCIVTSCPTGYYVNSGICTLMPSQRARLAKKDKIPKKKALCPGSETACPIAGSASFSSSLVEQFASLNGLDSLDANGGYECVDTQSALDSCGGCASIGQGQDCNAIPHVAGVGCDAGACVVFSCTVGFRPSIDGKTCVRAGSMNANHTRADSKRHLQQQRARHQRLGSHHAS